MVGNNQSSPTTPSVKSFLFNDGNWLPSGIIIIDGQDLTYSGYFGSIVSISGDGNYVGVGLPSSDGSAGVFSTSPSPCLGCTNIDACNYSEYALEDNGSCLFFDECGVCGGDDTSCDLQECADNDDTVSALGGCINAIAFLGCDFLYDGTPVNELCPESCDSCPCESDINDNGVCDDIEVLGCTYEYANNYDLSATLDDGSCLFASCPDITSDNQEAFDQGVASVECPDITSDNQEVYDAAYQEGVNSVDCQDASCLGDLDGDGEIVTNDLLIFLGAFGSSCE